MSSTDQGTNPADTDDLTPTTLSLAGDFPKATEEQWEREVEKVLNRGRPPEKQLTFAECLKRLTVHTVDGIDIVPMYRPKDAPKKLGYPGVAPFTRGTTVRNGDMDAWDVRALHEDPDEKFTRKAILEGLERGVTSLLLRVDPDAIAPEHLDEVLSDVLLEMTKVEVFSRYDQDAAAEALVSVYERSDKPAKDLALNLGLDPIGFAALQGTEPDLTVLGDWVRRLAKFSPDSRAVTIDANIYHNAGAGDVAELAWALATGAEYVRALVEQGFTATEAFDTINFRVTATHDQFLTIARLRALREAWARIGEVFGVDEDKRGARQNAITSWRELTREDPYVNILRGSIATFSASVGGAESITTLPFTQALGLPEDDFPLRIARNTGIVLAEEVNIGRVNDPAGGSYYVESLTRSLADAAWKEFQEVEKLGGMSKAVMTEHVTKVLDACNAERAKRLANRKQPITAVSEFPMIGARSIETKPFPAAPARKGLAWHRDSEVFEQLMDRSTSVSERPKVFLACLGTRRDFGGREGFSSPVWHIAGIDTPQVEGGTTAEIVEAFKKSGAQVADLCSSAKVYAQQGLEVAKALKAAGAKALYLSGAFKEFGDDAAEAEKLIDGRLFMGMDVVDTLSSTLDILGVAK
ncbi:methylmalonyl-CoA mutase small subunit [Propionibacterium freudenreichii]|uniref:methylmalonyl-CoA mutase small subunit n=1 Tax=Propionibacterium freudenreichii TaxID=1744 RepID=UPI00254BD7F7|nr:methylmalonyl-CoA mutase small subunit [Propionibacterium freudenreichii]MDK9352736.1 methylmalonyl-CoA mutase small subunit [Propionibacterium freudenreichii]